MGSGYDGGAAVKVQPDGKILLAGGYVDNYGISVFALARVNSDGTSDFSFNTNGKVFISLNNSGYISYFGDIALQSDGKIVLVGMSRNDSNIQGFGVARLNSDGSLDNSFSGDGKVITPIGYPYPGASCVAIQPDGKILVGGESSENFSPATFALIRYLPDGNLDPSFSLDGKVTTAFGNLDPYDIDEALDIVVQPDGKILMTGYSYSQENAYCIIPIVRYNVDGSLDNSFGTSGKSFTVITGYPGVRATSINLQEDNKIVVAGYCDDNDHQICFVSRFLTNGSLDSTFGTNGILLDAVDTTNGTLNYIFGSKIDQQGKIVTAGYTYQGMTVVRYLSGFNVGILNIRVSDAPILIYPNPIKSNATLEYSLTENEKITVSLIDLQGKQVQTFIVNQDRTAGEHKEELYFDDALPAGNYVLQISNGVHQQRIKIILAK